MKLLAISNPTFFPDEAELINSLFREGLVCLHIRKPESDLGDFRNLLNKINPDFLDRISMHQHHHLAGEFGIKRLHFTENERKLASTENLKKLRSDGFLLSTSIHNLLELDNLLEHFKYTFFGPVFDSISKVGYKGVLADNFYLKPETKKISVIGLGGISSENMAKVRKMNFDGVAVLGTLWNDPENVISNFRELRNMADPVKLTNYQSTNNNHRASPGDARC